MAFWFTMIPLLAVSSPINVGLNLPLSPYQPLSGLLLKLTSLLNGRASIDTGGIPHHPGINAHALQLRFCNRLRLFVIILDIANGTVYPAIQLQQFLLPHTINNLGVTTENITAAESRIRDVDMAKEMMEFTKNSVLMQSAQAMLAQANQQPQSILQLLQ